MAYIISLSTGKLGFYFGIFHLAFIKICVAAETRRIKKIE